MSEEITDNHLYAIELEDKKVFLHLSPPIYQDYLFQECIVLYEFVNKYRPIQVLKVIDINDILEVDYYVKYYMRYYGIENVRGGNYTNEVLSPDILKLLEMEINTKLSHYEKNIEIFESIIQNHQKESLNDKSIKKLDDSYEYYLKRQKLLSIIYLEESYEDIADFQIYSSIIRDIEWMKDIILDRQNLYERFFSTVKEEPERYNIVKIPNHVITDDKNRYKDILKKLDFLRRGYLRMKVDRLSEYLDSYLTTKIGNFKSYDTCNDDSLTFVHIRHPEYILDYFFMHPRYINNWNTFVESGNNLLDELLYMAHAINNLIDELRFDLSKFHPDFEKTCKYTKNYYKLLEEITLNKEEALLLNEHLLEEELEKKWMETDIKEYYNNKEFYDNFQKLNSMV